MERQTDTQAKKYMFLDPDGGDMINQTYQFASSSVAHPAEPP